MTLRVNNLGYNLTDLARTLGYRPLGYTGKGELNCVRPLGAAYPRFHVYMKATPDVLTLNIHLDQKKVSYEGATAHSGDYDSDTVKEEVARIKEIIFRMH
ncbi:MAG: hypothetical protein ABSE18_03315 [Minisyncoccia bacterium]|jgi:hypothetical protein